METKTIEYLDLKPERVARVYKGKPHTCYCGCAGEYFADKKVIARAIKYGEKNGKIVAFSEGIITVRLSETKEYTFYFGDEELAELESESKKEQESQDAQELNEAFGLTE